MTDGKAATGDASSGEGNKDSWRGRRREGEFSVFSF
jgi:hypothetical protein